MECCDVKVISWMMVSASCCNLFVHCPAIDPAVLAVMPKDPPALSTRLPMPGLSSAPVKRFRPPNIDLTLASEKRGPVIEVESESPISDDDDDDILQLSSDSSPSTSPIVPILNLDSSDEEGASDDISKDLAALDQLRKSVQKNLKLRPIRSHSNLQKVDLPGRSPFAPPLSSVWRDSEPDSATSTTSSTYFTPLSDAHSSPQSARYLGFSTSNSSSPFRPPATLAPRSPRSIGPTNLVSRLTSEKRPLLIDTRPPSSHLSFHIRHSINIAIPSLILKRCRKPGGGFQSLDALRQFITTDQSKERWDTLLSSGGPWDGDVVVYDDEMDLKNKDNVGVTSWALLPVLIPLLSYGSVDYLEGGISAAGHCPALEALIVSAGDYDLEGAASPQQQQGKKGGGLFQLDTQSALRSRALPEIEPSSASPGLSPIPPSPLPVMPAATRTTANGTNSNNAHQPNIIDASPSPPPSSVGFRRPPPPQRRPSVPGLQRISTTSAERLGASPPKLSVRTGPLRSATLSVPPSYFPSTNASLQPPASPSHLNLMYSNHSPPGSARWTPIGSSPSALQTEFLSAYFTPPHTPGTPKPLLPSSPSTARPELEQPPTTEEAFPVFIISTILPGFLYLGPELTAPEHVDELKELGVRRILNIAAECDDDQGLRLKEVFEKYVKIPMRDTVEEENIARGVREVCEILGEDFIIPRAQFV